MKGIKLFLGTLAAASLLFSVSANAQENNNRDENGKVVRGAYETNKVFDNVFVGVGVGYNAGVYGFGAKGTSFGLDYPINFSGYGGLGLDVYVGKWFTPVFGARVGYHGLANNVGVNSFGVTPNQHYVHGDLLWSLTNTFWGYKETRVWNVNPYVSAGWLGYKYAEDVQMNNEYAMGVGLLNDFRLTSRLKLVLDLSALLARAEQYRDAGRFYAPVSATVGLSYTFGKPNFDRHSSITPVVIPVPFTTDQYNALADKVAALEKENAALKDKVAALEKELAPYKNLVNGQTYLYENGTFTAVDVKAGSPVSVYFDLGSAQLSAREKAHLEYFAESVVNADTKLSVNGYADKQTGSAATNQKLSEKRVKTVVDYLVKAGANEAKIETAAHGSSVQLFNTAAKNRVVTIEVK